MEQVDPYQGRQKTSDVIAPMKNTPHLKATSKALRRSLLLQVQKQQCKAIRNTMNQGNVAPKNNNNPPITELKGTKSCDLAVKELKIAVLTK